MSSILLFQWGPGARNSWVAHITARAPARVTNVPAVLTINSIQMENSAYVSEMGRFLTRQARDD